MRHVLTSGSSSLTDSKFNTRFAVLFSCGYSFFVSEWITDSERGFQNTIFPPLEKTLLCVQMQKIKNKQAKQADKCAARSHHTGWFGGQFPQVLAVSWLSFHLESVSSYRFMICFHGHFVGELKEIVSSPSYQITVETGTSYMQLQKNVANLNFYNPQKHNSVANCLSGAPPDRPCSPSSPISCFTTFPSVTFTRHPDSSLLLPVLSTLPQLWPLVPVGCSFWKELFHSISIPLYSTHRNVSHHIPHSILFSSFQSLLQPGCFCVDHSHRMDVQP